MTGPDPYVTRKNVRHAIIRRRNERIAAGGPEFDDWPTSLHVSEGTLDDLKADPDGDEQNTMDFEGTEFMRLPVIVDPSLADGEFAVSWAREVPS